jgi:protein kinase-like protein
MQTGKTFGKWQAVERLGKGGNGEVWRCSADGQEAAVKVLHRNKDRDRIVRFRNEIKFLLSQPERQGIVPLIDHELPDDPGDATWFAMPIAQPIAKALGLLPNPGVVVEAVASISNTLTELLREGVSHRDLKPDNLFRLGEGWAVGDFGLVTYPERESLTRKGRKLGPTDYMAPEMRDAPDEADPELADVYSLAKTLWVLITGNALPLPGQHRADDDMCRLTMRIDYPRVENLDLLVEACTANDPRRRWRMNEVARELNALQSDTSSGGMVSADDTSELENRIAAQIEIYQRRDVDRQGFHRRVSACWEPLEGATREIYFGLAEGSLRGFGTQHPVQITPPGGLERTPVIPGYHRQWSGLLVAPAGANVHVELGTMMRVHDESGKCTVVAIIRVNRHNAGRGSQVTILQEQTESIVGSAHIDSVVSEISSAFARSLPAVLKAVSDALTEEQRLSVRSD